LFTMARRCAICGVVRRFDNISVHKCLYIQIIYCIIILLFVSFIIRFPSDARLRTKWVEFVEKCGISVAIKSMLCSRHFIISYNYFRRDAVRHRMSNTEVPCLVSISSPGIVISCTNIFKICIIETKIMNN